MADLESSLAAFEQKLADVQKTVDALNATLRQLKKAAGSGDVSEIDKGLGLVGPRSAQVSEVAATLPAAWTFDVRGYLEQGFSDELQREARIQGLTLVERDGRLYSFPLVVRLEPRDRAVRVGPKRQRGLRPKELVRQLLALQKSKPRANASLFLETLYAAYRHLRGPKEGDVGPVIPLADIHALLTLLPGTDYRLEEFGRDLLLLSRQPDLRTRDGSTFEFPGSTMSKERVKRITIFDEEGREVSFIAVRFRGGT